MFFLGVEVKLDATQNINSTSFYSVFVAIFNNYILEMVVFKIIFNDEKAKPKKEN